MHYFAIGSEQHNKTTIAFKFYPKGVTPKYQVRSQNIRNIPNDELEVPPNSVVRTDGYFRLPRPARIDSFQPHMHMPGRGLTVEAIDPVTNRTFILSSVDHFDFNWHINYVYADDAAPLLPAGTVLHLIGIHDNTSANRRNALCLLRLRLGDFPQMQGKKQGNEKIRARHGGAGNGLPRHIEASHENSHADERRGRAS